MQTMMQKAKQSASQNIDKRIVVSTAVGVAVFGTAVFLLNKSNVKALKEVTKVAKGGK